MKDHMLYINGRWEEALDGRITEDRNPATNAVFARVHTAGPRDLEKALASAADAFGPWSSALASEREAVLLHAASCLEEMREEAESLLIEESGSAWQKAHGEVLASIAVLKTAAGECRRVGGEVYSPEQRDNFSFSVRCPLGVILAIAPFNYPLLLAMKKVAYALAAGNSVLLKPASATPLSGLLIARVFHDAGLPAGVLNVLPCPGALIGRHLAEDPRVKAVTFTGSTETGRQLAQQAARLLKRCTMELGGKNPMLVLADYDVAQAAHLAGYGAFFHQGQVCMATSRIVVEKPSYSAFCEEMKKRAEALKVGDPREKDTVIGPLIDQAQCEVIDRQIRDALEKGARLVTGGRHDGPFYAPTVLADVTPEMDIFQQESFGPVTSVICAENAEEALALCNNNCYGLSSSILTNDLSKAISLALRMEAGKVHVNDTTFVSGTVAPSGGCKLSGIGKEGGRYSIEEFTELKWITVQYKDRHMPC